MKLDLNQLLRIRVERRHGTSADELARRYRITPEDVAAIVAMKSPLSATTRSLRAKKKNKVHKGGWK